MFETRGVETDVEEFPELLDRAVSDHPDAVNVRMNFMNKITRANPCSWDTPIIDIYGSR